MAALLALCPSCVLPPMSSYPRRPGFVTSSESSCWRKSFQVQPVSVLRRNQRALRLGKVRSRSVRAAFGEPNDRKESSSVSATLNDLKYLGKFFAASTAGAALVKYGSVLVPSITQPNLLQALIMISTPVLVSVVLLLVASSEEQPDEWR